MSRRIIGVWLEQSAYLSVRLTLQLTYLEPAKPVHQCDLSVHQTENSPSRPVWCLKGEIVTFFNLTLLDKDDGRSRKRPDLFYPGQLSESRIFPVRQRTHVFPQAVCPGSEHGSGCREQKPSLCLDSPF